MDIPLKTTISDEVRRERGGGNGGLPIIIIIFIIHLPRSRTVTWYLQKSDDVDSKVTVIKFWMYIILLVLCGWEIF